MKLEAVIKDGFHLWYKLKIRAVELRDERGCLIRDIPFQTATTTAIQWLSPVSLYGLTNSTPCSHPSFYSADNLILSCFSSGQPDTLLYAPAMAYSFYHSPAGSVSVWLPEQLVLLNDVRPGGLYKGDLYLGILILILTPEFPWSFPYFLDTASLPFVFFPGTCGSTPGSDPFLYYHPLTCILTPWR